MKRAITAVICLITVVAISLAAMPLYHKSPAAVNKNKTVVVAQPKPAEKSNRVGDTQNIGDMNVTLNRVFSVSPTVFGVDISTDYGGVLDPQFIPKGAWLYTSDGKYVHSSSVEGTTAYFTIPPNVYVDTFLFYNFRWYL